MFNQGGGPPETTSFGGERTGFKNDEDMSERDSCAVVGDTDELFLTQALVERRTRLFSFQRAEHDEDLDKFLDNIDGKNALNLFTHQPSEP